ncbi:MAG: hypothetical protein H7A09_00120 [Oceanospirillaceae bacterium]|nr:hypothetical protein [Oceanospirillaceae bacterium]MCP5334811.1 hypothetical protein [Oceanospirillaceae bacterium]MCP5350481.1 hypothetical protein [Oceanospirillaceae bacterium]
MRLFIGLFMLSFMANASGKPAWLGVFTTDNYPVSGCMIVKAGTYIQHSSSGYEFQPQDLNDKNSYINAIQELQYSNAIASFAQKNGFNAIVGYQFNVYGGFDSYNGNVTNGKMGIGLFYAVARGTPVTVECK